MDMRKNSHYLRKVGVFILLICGLVLEREMLFAENILPRNRANSKDYVVVHTPDSGESTKPAVYDLKRWKVEESTDPVQHALEVYKKKSESKYVKRVWITDKKNGKRRMIVEYTPRGANDKVMFSQDEDFMYYLGLTPAGENIVYGVNLSNEDKFSLGTAEDFNMVRCPDKNNYIVLQQGQQRSVYNIYTVNGKKAKTITNIQDPVDIEKSLCH
ncbi:MAG TPA: hypothetical protein PL155_02070 [Candidatus Omnitrophota bacterium]|nr:hypothetical protein [Candidatus Omnitrophota bacterium]HPD84725.1 hypothetical protein [Candidatus Omnitrophota bacterium]HRZ03583.1 hypothetical protein [Candidatus Omnitrophota bacterium]